MSCNGTYRQHVRHSYTAIIPHNVGNTKSYVAFWTIGSQLSTQQKSGRQASVTDTKRSAKMTSSSWRRLEGEGTATPARPVSQLAIYCPPYGSISLARQTKHQEETSARNSSKTSFRRQMSMSCSFRFLAGKTASHCLFSFPKEEGTPSTESR